MKIVLRAVICGVLMMSAAFSHADLDPAVFLKPTREFGPNCWWWWLNGNVTQEAITKDLEAMHAKGFSGAIIFDAGNELRWGPHETVSAGPLFGTPQWAELYMHALREAQRLDLKMGMLIQSGWNLGGPNVTPEFAAKQLAWSETRIEGPGAFEKKLPVPNSRSNYYEDIAVLAIPEKAIAKSFTLKASSQRDEFPAARAVDGDPATFWVSSGQAPGEGPTAEKPEWLQLTFEERVAVAGLRLEGRKGYGPKKCRMISPDSGKESQVFTLKDGFNEVKFDPLEGMTFRIVFEESYDPQHPASPRNVQLCRLEALNKEGHPVAGAPSGQPIADMHFKASLKRVGRSAPDTRFLLNAEPELPGDAPVSSEEILNISDRMDADGTLRWQIPAGRWTIMRFGYTIASSHVATSSGDWKGLVIDYLSKEAFDRYWFEIVDPLLKMAGPLAGTVLTHLETDSWEVDGMNWSPYFAKDFKQYRGYDPIPYLPVLAGRIVTDRRSSNAFLADFRKTLGDCMAENHYKVFAGHAARYKMGIMPESAGPHAGPFDGIKNYQYSDIVMSEFWVPSPHRAAPRDRFFVKQASSAAHIYGKKYVGAEGFTSVGPHWDDVLWKSQKPAMDHEYCSGLNMVFFHTFTCSPKEMGLPGQEYFAGTHVNPQVTWWERSDEFMNYISRTQYVLQQGRFIADVLYYYGDHVPNVFPLKESDPAGALPGYDYDVTNEDVLLKLKVVDGRLVVPGGVRYRMLVLPEHRVLSLAALEKVQQILQQGGTVLGAKAERLVSLVGGETAQRRFSEISDQLWTAAPAESGERRIGPGRLLWGRSARQVLQADGVAPDFEIMPAAQDVVYDYIHYTVNGAEVYFISNQSEQPQRVDALFRVSGRQPELWDPVTGRIRTAQAFRQSGGRTVVPLEFDPCGSLLVVFRDAIPIDQSGSARTNFPELKTVKEISGPWQVAFHPAWGAPASVQFDALTDWTLHSQPGIQNYSGEAVYKKSFALPEHRKGQSYWLILNSVEDIGVAAVTLNGKDFGTLWTKPFRVEITDAVTAGENRLEIAVVNSWRNRLVGDRGKPQDQRFTKTNIKIQDKWTLLSSGLIGPVVIQAAE